MKHVSWIALAGVLALSLAAGIALAGGNGGQSYSDCLKNAPTTAAMQACITKEYKRVDGLLNKVYGQLAHAKIDKALLLAAETKWIAFRDADCKFAGSFNAGGSLAAINQGDCLITDEAARLKQLQSYLKQATSP
jgi:uncharacterized protein YecT (DUF1311 family)